MGRRQCSICYEGLEARDVARCYACGAVKRRADIAKHESERNADMKRQFIAAAFLVMLVSWVVALAQAPPPPTTTAPAPPSDAFDQRAAAVVKPMRFSDADKTETVTKLTADYLRNLHKILGDRQAALDKIGQGTAAAATPELDKQLADAWKVSRKEAVALRDAYAAQLAGLMTPYQVERVKDGITEDCFPRTLQVYDEMIPGLTHPQRAHVVGLLTEMRENAMLELNPDPQEKWVDKYRGIINNYIAKQGHDFTALSKAYDAKKNAKE